MTIRELVARWDLSPAHAYRIVNDGTLPSLRIGSAIRIPIEAIEKFEERGGTTAA